MEFTQQSNHCKTVDGSKDNQIALASLSGTRGFICRVVVVTDNSTNPILFYDGTDSSAATVLGVVPASATAGQNFDFQMPFQVGIFMAGATSAGDVTVGWYS